MTAPLPFPTPEAQEASLALSRLITREIEAAGGWIGFARYMELALHAPGLGYYGGGARKFGDAGDFVTAPELTPLFGQTLAVQVGQIMAFSAPAVLEVGAGSGRLAVDLLRALDVGGHCPDSYWILELSGELRARQQHLLQQELPGLMARIRWLDSLPDGFSGCVVANELLDAMPVHSVAWTTTGNIERGVTAAASTGFVWEDRPATGSIAQAMDKLAGISPCAGELGLAAQAWVAEWGRRLHAGALLLIDYGLPRAELYHPQRARGTLRCHYQHRSHENPFWWPGLSDITAHVDFTAIAEAGYDAGLDVLGYTTQANFLINCGLGELLAARRQTDDASYLRANGAVQTLISPQEMGELFKVIALGKGLVEPLSGFSRGDRSHTL